MSRENIELSQRVSMDSGETKEGTVPESHRGRQKKRRAARTYQGKEQHGMIMKNDMRELGESTRMTKSAHRSPQLIPSRLTRSALIATAFGISAELLISALLVRSGQRALASTSLFWSSRTTSDTGLRFMTTLTADD